MKKLVIFDLDGTLLNTIDDLADSVNFALTQFNLPNRTVLEVRSFVGNGIRNLINRAVPSGLDVKTIDKVYNVFKEHYTNNCNVKTKPYDGILDLLKSLKDRGILTGIVSNKNNEAVKELSKIYFNELIDIARGHIEGEGVKPNPDGVNYIINTLNVDKKDCVYIGDSDVDYYTAKNANIDSILVSWGFRDRGLLESLENAIIVDEAKSLKGLLYD